MFLKYCCLFHDQDVIKDIHMACVEGDLATLKEYRDEGCLFDSADEVLLLTITFCVG